MTSTAIALHTAERLSCLLDDTMAGKVPPAEAAQTAYVGLAIAANLAQATRAAHRRTAFPPMVIDHEPTNANQQVPT